MTEKATLDPAAKLRRCAEKRAKADEADVRETLSREEVRLLLHDLRVHQIELEVQNEELHRAQVELETSRARYFDLYDLAPVGYFTVSEQGLIIEANLTAAGLLGVPRAALAKKPLSRFIFRGDQAIYYQHRQQLFETGAPQACEFRMLHASAGPFWVRMEAVAAQDAAGAPVGRAVMIDITEEKEAALEIQKLNEALQKHVVALDEVNKELESYNHSVSHDLRVPLRFINRIAHSLLQDDFANRRESGLALSDGAVQQMNAILLATGEMEKLIENLLVLSQANHEPLQKRRVNPRQLFETALHELNPMERRDGIEIRIQDLEPCQGDPTLLKEVAVNLLDNALKFTRPRDPARITIGSTQTETETTYFVQDNGVGFDMQKADSLFVPFRRLHKADAFEGTGIGLALVRRIIDRHGGRIWAEGKVGKGATFYFTLGNEALAKTTAKPVVEARPAAFEAKHREGKGQEVSDNGFKDQGSGCRRRYAVRV